MSEERNSVSLMKAQKVGLNIFDQEEIKEFMVNLDITIANDPDIQAINERFAVVAEEAKRFTVNTATDEDNAKKLEAKLTALKKEVEAIYKPASSFTDEVHNLVTGKRGAIVNQIDKGLIPFLKQKREQWRKEESARIEAERQRLLRIAQAEEAARQAELRRQQQEADRKAREAQAVIDEANRKKREAQEALERAKNEEERKAAEEAARQAQEAQKKANAAVQVQAAQEAKAAALDAQIEDRQENFMPDIKVKETPKIQQAEVTDLTGLMLNYTMQRALSLSPDDLVDLSKYMTPEEVFKFNINLRVLLSVRKTLALPLDAISYSLSKINQFVKGVPSGKYPGVTISTVENVRKKL